jgi:hypothetical protein
LGGSVIVFGFRRQTRDVAGTDRTHLEAPGKVILNIWHAGKLWLEGSAGFPVRLQKRIQIHQEQRGGDIGIEALKGIFAPSVFIYPNFKF